MIIKKNMINYYEIVTFTAELKKVIFVYLFLKYSD